MYIRNLANLLLAVVLLCVGDTTSAWSAGPQPNTAAPAPSAQADSLYQFHIHAGLNCASCHKETPPSTPAGTPTCLSCHGSYQVLAKKTENVTPNPHDSHQGHLPCESCHHIHKPSVNFCNQCHQWGFKVP